MFFLLKMPAFQLENDDCIRSIKHFFAKRTCTSLERILILIYMQKMFRLVHKTGFVKSGVSVDLSRRCFLEFLFMRRISVLPRQHLAICPMFIRTLQSCSFRKQT